MATYTTPEVQQMKQGGNAVFAKTYLAKWNASTFPAPVDKNPKRVEDFIRQVLVEKVFYDEAGAVQTTTITNKPPQPSNSWQAFSEDPKPQSNSEQSSGTINWADFTPAPATKAPVDHPFDPFTAGSPSPKSVKSTPADPFSSVAQQRSQSWDPFQTPDPPSQTTLPHPEAKPDNGSTTPPPSGKKSPPAMSPLPEEWFSSSELSSQTDPFQTQSYNHFPPQPYQQNPYNAPPQSPYNAPPQNPYSAFPTQNPYTFNPQAARASLGSSSSFRSATGASHQSGFPSLVQPDSATSYVSNRVDESSHHPLFQNLDMDMRAKAHSVAGVPIQTPQLYQSSNQDSFGANPTVQLGQSFMQTPPQSGFDGATGNPFGNPFA